MSADFILEVNETNFEYEVIAYSQNIPVAVEFCAEWSRACKTINPLLTQIAMENQGSFRLAKLDVDANPNLAMMYSVRSVPTIKTFVQGQVVGELAGLQPENRLREFFDALMPPSQLSLSIEKANELLGTQKWTEAETIFREVLEQEPNEPKSLIGLSKALLAQGHSSAALNILENFPDSRELNTAELLKPLADAIQDLHGGKLPTENDLEITYKSSINLVSRGNVEAGIDGLLDILRQDKRFHRGQAKEIILALLEILGEANPQTRDYRKEMASILF